MWVIETKRHFSLFEKRINSNYNKVRKILNLYLIFIYNYFNFAFILLIEAF